MSAIVHALPAVSERSGRWRRRAARGLLALALVLISLLVAYPPARAAGPAPTSTPTPSPSPAPTATPNPNSPYLLPWPGGLTAECVQGNNGSFSHRGMEKYAWDFAMPIGSVVLAARGGVVSFVYQDSNIGGTNWAQDASKGNYVVINQGDGTSGVYLHLMYHGALVKVGDTVSQGQPIADSGATGFASGPHLHFMVERTDANSWFAQSIPVSFKDVTDHGGVPVEDETYTSGNAKVAVTRAPTVIPLANATPQPTAPTGGASNNTLSASFGSDLSLPDGSAVRAGQTFTKAWSVRNTGSQPWPDGTHLVRDGAAQVSVLSAAAVDAIPPGGSANVSVTVRVPTSAANAALQEAWRLSDSDGNLFGDQLWLRVQVGAPLPTLPAKASAAAGSQFFAPTGHNVDGRFLAFYRSHGGLDLFGYPRTEAIQEGGLTVQYFQRARFEYHPELSAGQQVQLTLLGDQLTTSQRPFPTASPFTSSADHRYFPETHHSVNFAFLRYFDTHGGVTVFGYPTSEELATVGPHGPTTIQYFQRARFEYHPEFAGTPYDVELGLLGDETLTAMGWLPLPPTDAPPAADNSSSKRAAAASAPTPTSSPAPTATPAPSTSSGPTPMSGKTATVTAMGLRVHSGPSADQPVVTYLVKGDQVKVVATQNGWAQVVTASGKQGWVDAGYLAGA